MKLRTITSTSLLTFSLAVAIPLSMAAGNHEGGHSHDEPKKGHSHDGEHNGGQDMNDMKMSNSKNKMFLKKKKIDGYEVTFHVMDAKDGMKMGDEKHHLMIKVKDKGKELNNIKVNSKIFFPDGKAESKMLMKMNGWYMAGYDLNDQGKHQMMILFKTADGKKHSGGVYYSK